jgi:adenine-specific DNA-methyltransferase
MKQANNQIFTPEHIVSFMLKEVNYVDNNVLSIKFMEPSFGDGAFLIPMIQTIIDVSIKNNLDETIIKRTLLNNVFGIEKDMQLYQNTVQKIDCILNQYGIGHIDWSNNLFCDDTLRITKRWKKKFDLVIGNPPYTRIHHLDAKTRKLCNTYVFGQGMKDLYVLFYEAGINMLKDTGVLCFITPNSFMYNSSQKAFRKHLIEHQLLEALYDFKSEKVFDSVDTYTCICKISKTPKAVINYYDATKAIPGIKQIKDYTDNRFSDGSPWYFNLSTNNFTEKKISENYNVQYGIATNADKIFIGKAYADKNKTVPILDMSMAPDLVYFNDSLVEKAILRSCVKASTFNGVPDNTYIVFPYAYTEDSYNVIAETELKTQYPNLEKRKILFPFYQIKRWGRLLFGKDSKNVSRELKASINVQADKKERIAKLFKNLDL